MAHYGGPNKKLLPRCGNARAHRHLLVFLHLPLYSPLLLPQLVSQHRATRHCAAAGLDQYAISALPTFTFQRATYRGGKDHKGISAECAVCIDSVEDGETVRLLPNCEHVFHVECIDMWLHSHSTCPLCRTEAEPGKMVAKMVVGEVCKEILILQDLST